MLINLTPKNTARTEAEKHAKDMNKYVREFTDKKYYPVKFTDLFIPTKYKGVYWSCGDSRTVEAWCKQRLLYDSDNYWKHYNSFTRDEIRDCLAYDNNAWKYGVADSLEQVVNFYNENKDGYFKGNHVIFCQKVIKNPNEPCSGWRWHKWGEYIGVQNPKCEYLNDEQKIDEVITFSIYKILY